MFDDLDMWEGPKRLLHHVDRFLSEPDKKHEYPDLLRLWYVAGGVKAGAFSMHGWAGGQRVCMRY